MSFIMEILQNIMLLLGFVGGGNSFPKPLSKEEEAKYIDLMEQGDERAKNILIEHNLRLVAHIAKKYATDSNFDDLVSTGTIGLIKGINTFDRTKTSKLTTYIARCIENEVLMVLRAAKKSAGDVSLDETIGVDKEGNNMTFSLSCAVIGGRENGLIVRFTAAGSKNHLCRFAADAGSDPSAGIFQRFGSLLPNRV